MKIKFHNISLVLLFIFSLSSFSFALDCNWTGNVSNDWMDAGNWDCGQVPTTADNVIINASGTPNLNADTEIGGLTMSQNPSILGNGVLIINGSFIVLDDSQIIIEPTTNCLGAVTWGDAVINFNVNPISIENTIVLNATQVWFQDLASLTVESEATMTANGYCPIFGFTNIASFIINGTLNIENDGFLDFEAVYLFENASINIINGSLINYLQNGSNTCIINNSTINISPNQSFQIARTIAINNSTFIGGGKISQVFGVANINGTTSFINIDLEVIDGIFNCNESLHQVNNISLADGRIEANNTMPLFCTGDLSWSGGDLEGLVIIEGNCNITDNTAGVELRFTDDLRINGGGSITANDNFIGTITINENPNNFTVYANEETLFNNLVLNGTLVKEGAADITISNFLTINETGVLAGNGRVNHDIPIFNNGTIAPNSITTPFILNSNVSVLFQETSVLEVNIEAASNDLLISEADLTLDGLLSVDEGTDIPNGVYTIISSTGTISGTFTSLDLPEFYSVEYLSNTVQIVKDEPVGETLSATITAVDVSCFDEMNGEITINATGGQMPYEYTLIGFGTQDSNTFSGLSAGNYDVLLMDAAGLVIAYSQISINTPAPIILDLIINQDNIICTAFGGTGQLVYSIDNGVTWQEESIFNNLISGDYDVCAMDENGCIICTTTTIDLVEIAIVSVTNVTCDGENDGIITVEATGGTEPYQFTLDGVNFQSEPTFENLSPGDYEVSVIDANEVLMNTEQVVINSPEPITVSATALDYSFSVMASGGTGALMYSIDNISFQTENVFLSLEIDTYTVYVKDENDCLAVTEVTVFVSGVKDVFKNNIKLFPNPASNKVYLEFDEISSPIDISIYNSVGVKILNKTEGFNQLNVENLQNGQYFVRVNFENYSSIVSFLKM